MRGRRTMPDAAATGRAMPTSPTTPNTAFAIRAAAAGPRRARRRCGSRRVRWRGWSFPEVKIAAQRGRDRRRGRREPLGSDARRGASRRRQPRRRSSNALRAACRPAGARRSMPSSMPSWPRPAWASMRSKASRSARGSPPAALGQRECRRAMRGQRDRRRHFDRQADRRPGRVQADVEHRHQGPPRPLRRHSRRAGGRGDGRAGAGRPQAAAPRAVRLDQWHLNRSNGSRQSLQRHCALHGVEPKRLTSSVSVEPHCGQVAALASSGGAMP